MESNVAAPDLYLPPEVDLRDAAVLNAVYARRPAIECVIAGFHARVAPAWADLDEPASESSTIHLLIDKAPAELLIDTPMLEELFSTAEPGLNLKHLSPEHAGLLLEFILRETLTRLENATRTKLSILSVGQSDNRIADSMSLRFAVVIERIGACWCWLTMPRYVAAKVAGLLGSRKAQRPPVINGPVPLALRVGHVTLAASELRGLQVGDIILAEESCPPSTAAAVIAEHLAAPVELTEAGARLAGAPNLLARSALGWSGGSATMPMAGPPEGAADSIPIRVFFELDRQVIAVSEVRGLVPGATLQAALAGNPSVDIVADGRRIGRGDPIAIGEGRGVRVRQLFAHE